MSSERERRVAFVGEDWDMEAELLSARFSVHWEERGGDGHAQGPAGVALDEALAWSRAHATVVYVTLGDRRYSAGSEQRDSEQHEIEPWPGDDVVVRPRPPGTPLDGSVQERAWELRATVRVPGRGVTEAVAGRLRAALAQEDGVGAVTVSRLEDDGLFVVFEVVDRSAGAAIRSSDARLERALRQAEIDGEVPRVEYSTHPQDAPPY